MEELPCILCSAHHLEREPCKETIELVKKRQERLLEIVDYAKSRLKLKQDEFAVGVIEEMMNIENNIKGMK